MERLLTTRDIAERYQCTLQCARNYIRKMEHQENPLRVTEAAFRAWEMSRTYIRRKAIPQQQMIVPKTR